MVSNTKTGLKNFHGTKSHLRRDYGYYGLGIYISPYFQTSYGYSSPVVNLYPKSRFPNIFCISLCEVANVPELKKCTEDETTLQDEKAIILRFIFVSEEQYLQENQQPSQYLYQQAENYNLEKHPITKIPTLNDVLKYFSKK